MTASTVQPGGNKLLPWTLAVAVAAAIVFALLAFVGGQDANWDFYNYHFYNPYAFLNDRFWFDIQPAQRQTNISPFLDLPFYWLTLTWNIVAASLSYAAFQGQQASAVFLIMFLFLDRAGLPLRRAIALALILTPLAALSPLNLQLTGTTTGDSTTAVLVLWAVCLFLLAQSRFLGESRGRTKMGLFMLAGILVGAATGLKLTNGPYAVALAACALMAADQPDARFKRVLLVGLSMLAGFLLAYGYWGWFLYSEFQNPLFPTFNQVFQSDFMKAVQLNDETFKATTPLGVAFYPFLYNAYTGALNYQQFHDLRVPVVFVLVVLALVALAISPGARSRLKANPLASTMILFVLVSYVIWIYLFSISRYLVVLEVLALSVALTVAAIVFEKKLPSVILLIAAFTTIGVSTWHHTQRDNVFGYRSAWADTVFEIQFPDLDPGESMVLVSGGQAMAYLIPFLPQDTRWVRIDSNLNYVNYSSIEERYDNRMGERLRDAIANHDDRFYVMYTNGEERYVRADLAYFGIAHDPSSCLPVRSKAPPLIICSAYRTP